MRNPFAGKGYGVTLALLLAAPAPLALVDLAAAAEASPTLVTRCVRALQAEGLVAGDIVQGREAAVVARQALFWAAAERWPAPAISVQGGTIPADLPVGGGRWPKKRLGVTATSPPCVYVRRQRDLGDLLSLTGGALVSEPVAAWQVAVVDYPFAPGPLPDVALALELGRTPRGREEVAPFAAELLADWPRER